MGEIQWGESRDGVAFGLRGPVQVETGGSAVLELHCRNGSSAPIHIYGFRPEYPRSLRVSPPKADRPHVLVAFNDLNVLHPPNAFTSVAPGEEVATPLDLSFAMERLGAGDWPVVFAYEPVRSAGKLEAWGGATMETGGHTVSVRELRSLRDAGIDAALESELEMALLAGDPGIVERLRGLGSGGAELAARRVVKVLMAGPDSVIGWRALDALALLGSPGLAAVRRLYDVLPHGQSALDFAADWIAHRLNRPPNPTHLRFISSLERLIEDPQSRRDFALTWTDCDSAVHGTRRLQILGSGQLIRTARAPGATMLSTWHGQLGETKMRSVLESLRYSAVWLLRPLRVQGLPDEPRPELEVQLELGDPLARRIEMWNGEWRQGPGAHVADLLHRLTHELLPSG